MTITKTKRNYKIEIIRLIACMLVIWCHIRDLPWKADGDLSETAILFETITSTCVTTFFMLTGFFIYNKNENIIKNWIKLLINYLLKIFIPFIIAAIFTLIFHDYIVSLRSFRECISTIDLKFICDSLFKSITTFDVRFLPDSAGHLWFVYAYGIIIISYPIVKIIIDKLNKKILYVLLLTYAMIMLTNDILAFSSNRILEIVFFLIPRQIFYSAFGYVLYNDLIKNKIDNINEKNDVIINKPLFFISLIIYIVNFIILFNTECKYLLTTNKDYLYTSFLSFNSFLMTTTSIIMLCDINFDKFVNEKIENIILYLSNKTLYIYLFHIFIVQKFLTLQIQYQFQKFRYNLFLHFIYYIIYGFVIFILSLLVAIIFNYIYESIRAAHKVRSNKCP